MTRHEPPTPATGRAGPPADHEARLENVLEIVSDGFYALDRDWRYVIFNRAAETYFGVSRDIVLGKVIWDIFPQGIGTPFERACRRAMDAREATTFETQSNLRPDRVVELRVAPMREGGIAVSLNDITERRRAEDALREAHDRSEEILESISDAFYAIDAEHRFTYVNRVAEAWWGRRREDLIGKVLAEEFPRALGTPAYEAQVAALRERREVRMEAMSPIIDRWIDISMFPSGTGLSVYFRDISGRKESERRQRLLVNELNHRVKNTLAVVQALARRTLGGAETLAQAREAFTARLMALAGAHDVITRETWTGADLGEVVDRSLLRQLDRPGRVRVEGPPVMVSPKLALSLSLALHELMTNAMKYGALSQDDGEVILAWRTSGEGADLRLHIHWAETGGPPVSPPKRRGFGSRLIERALAIEVGGRVALDFAPGGVVCDIDASLAWEAEALDPELSGEP
jgi:PAS domain S-box-containing protein